MVPDYRNVLGKKLFSNQLTSSTVSKRGLVSLILGLRGYSQKFFKVFIEVKVYVVYNNTDDPVIRIHLLIKRDVTMIDVSEKEDTLRKSQ